MSPSNLNIVDITLTFIRSIFIIITYFILYHETLIFQSNQHLYQLSYEQYLCLR